MDESWMAANVLIKFAETLKVSKLDAGSATIHDIARSRLAAQGV